MAETLRTKNTKPRVRFCFLCGKKLYGNRHLELSIEKITGDEIPRVMHKQCYQAEYLDVYF
jgi:hypothetical protein